MERIILPKSFNEEQQRFLKDLMDDAKGQPNILDANPVTADINDDQESFVPSSLRVYKKIDGVLYYYTLTAA